MFKGITDCIFDFDGTMVKSNSLKRSCFFEVVEDFESGDEIMTKMISLHNDRYTILGGFAAEVGCQAKPLIDRYSDMVDGKIREVVKRPGIQRLLDIMASRNFVLRILSATPQIHLVRAVELHFRIEIFEQILGSSAKSVSVKSILNDYHINPSSLMIIGDGIDDYDAAKKNGCNFLGVGGGSFEAKSQHGEFIDNFYELANSLEEVS